MYFPRIIVKTSDIDFNVNAIAELLYPGYCDQNKSLPFKERIYRAFPTLDGLIKDSMTNEEIHNCIEEMLYKQYITEEEAINHRKIQLQEKFDGISESWLSRLLDIFHWEWPKDGPDITCNLGFYAVFPRDVFTKAYWMHYKTMEEVVMRASVHEINHFIMFEKWKSMHGYNLSEEPSHPDALWFLEEMIIDPTLNTKEIQEVAPYTQRAYEKFYNNSINDKPVEQYIIDFFNNRKSIEDFLDTSYKFITDNIAEIIEKCG